MFIHFDSEKESFLLLIFSCAEVNLNLNSAVSWYRNELYVKQQIPVVDFIDSADLKSNIENDSDCSPAKKKSLKGLSKSERNKIYYKQAKEKSKDI